jgi:arylsulfatase A-like enzyme
MISGIKYPSSYNQRELHDLDGRSFLPVLQGEIMPGRTYCWKYEKHRAIRSGSWKLLGVENKNYRNDQIARNE